MHNRRGILKYYNLAGHNTLYTIYALAEAIFQTMED